MKLKRFVRTFLILGILIFSVCGIAEGHGSQHKHKENLPKMSGHVIKLDRGNVIRFEDTKAGMVCWVYTKGGIHCTPKRLLEWRN